MILTDSHVIAVKTSVGCQDDECRGFIGLSWLYDTEAEAIAAWNTRSAGTCRSIRILNLITRECDGESYQWRGDEKPNYCPNCGRKVSA